MNKLILISFLVVGTAVCLAQAFPSLTKSINDEELTNVAGAVHDDLETAQQYYRGHYGGGYYGGHHRGGYGGYYGGHRGGYYGGHRGHYGGYGGYGHHRGHYYG